MNSAEAKILDSIHFLRSNSPERGFILPNLEWSETNDHWKKVLAEPEFAKIAEEFAVIRKMAEELKDSIDVTKYRIIDRKLRELRILGMK